MRADGAVRMAEPPTRQDRIGRGFSERWKPTTFKNMSYAPDPIEPYGSGIRHPKRG